MKKKLLLLFLSVSFLQGIIAKDIYLYSTGSDVNDGLTPGTAIKTMTRVNDIVSSGDVIHIKGIIKLTDEPDYEAQKDIEGEAGRPTNNDLYINSRGYTFTTSDNWADITLLGEDPENDGFSGENSSPLFQMVHSYTFTFKNLKFTKGTVRKNSGHSLIWIHDAGNISFENCLFTENNYFEMHEDGFTLNEGAHGPGRGVVLISRADVNESNNKPVTFKDCVFSDNRSKEGGALYITGGHVKIDNCKFLNNNCGSIRDSRGGAIYTTANDASYPINIELTKSHFQGNTASAEGGALCLRNYYDGSEDAIRSTTVHINCCTFVENSSEPVGGWDWSRAGAISINNGRKHTVDNILILNSLFYANYTGKQGGAICFGNVQPDSEFVMVNSTLYGNYTTEGDGNAAGGIMILTEEAGSEQHNMIKRIYNCIVDGNMSHAHYGDRTAYTDMVFENEPLEVEIDCQYSYIGRIELYFDKVNANETNYVRYYEQEVYNDQAGLNDPDYYALSHYAIPLLDGVAARTFGNPEYLVNYGISNDLSGKERVLTDGKCVIGACETVGDELVAGMDLELFMPYKFYTDGGWETICVPFDVKQIVDGEGNEISGYKLKEFDKITYQGEQAILNFTDNISGLKAGVPYIISMPQVSGNDSCFYYLRKEEETRVAAALDKESAGYVFRGTLNEITTGAVGTYVLNAAGTEFVKGVAGSVIGNNKAYFTIPSSAGDPVKKLSINMEEGTTGLINALSRDLKISATGSGTICIESATSRIINMYHANGVKVSTLTLKEGSNYVNDLLPGTYIVDKKKVFIY